MKSNKEEQKVNYELILESLQAENQQLKKTVMEQNMFNVFKRLDYLFKAVEYRDAFSAEFSISVVEEIENLLTIDKTETSNEEHKQA